MKLNDIFSYAHTFDNILVHTDLFRAVDIPISDKNSFFDKHYNFLKTKLSNKNIFFPAFNYSFCSTGLFDIKNDPISVGSLNNYLWENNIYKYRTHCPIFSFIAEKDIKNFKINLEKIIDPFGKESFLHFLYQNNSCLLHYGSSIASTTLLHYVERIASKLLYRYDKIFKGNLKFNGNETPVQVRYHVRPLGAYLKYDWPKIEIDLLDNGIYKKHTFERTRISIVSIRKLVNFWLEKINYDYFYFLDKKSRISFENIYQEKGRAVKIRDYE